MIEALKIIQRASEDLRDEMRSTDSETRLAQIIAAQTYLLSVFDHVGGLKRMKAKLSLAPYVYYQTERAKRDVLSAEVIS